MKQKAIIIGAGIAGIAAAIRLAAQGKDVTVFEKNGYPGGKLSEFENSGFRFDKGPSLLTMPELIDELTALAGYPQPFKYRKLETITRYFYEDGTKLCASDAREKFAAEVSEKLGEDRQTVLRHLEKSDFYYNTIGDLFLKRSLSDIKNFLNLKTLRALLNTWRLPLLRTMHGQNRRTFRNKKTVQLFDRYATYNGSNPYKAPALLNIIPHLEFGKGAFLPENGMHDITSHLYKCALHLDVNFVFDMEVEQIILVNEKAAGIQCRGKQHAADMVVSDADIHMLYRKLLPEKYTPRKALQQERSSSAFVFFWGIRKSFPELDLHNILFSENYEEEFRHLFGEREPFNDPTVYINITSKYCRGDAPPGCENWFVMVNVPSNADRTAILYKDDLRKNVITKINRILKADIEELIILEKTLDPVDIESQTSSAGGSIYGNSSNTRFSAFLRHPNYSSAIKDLYFAGGSVHPGGGIPLCLLSAKIVADRIKKDHA